MMIKDFLDEGPMVSLFTRPRRFGKTLNMDMIRTFFEKTDEDTSVYFRDKKIWACGKKYRGYQGKYPVIFITFKDVKRNTWGETYDQIAKSLRQHLSYGFLTGILRVAKESIFSGLNNLAVHSILDHRYSEYFGFTSEKVEAIARYYHAEEKYGEICAWYDGYRFGDSELFNPWSVINYFSNRCQPRAFWQSTGSNEIIGEELTYAGEQIYERLNAMLQGESFLTYIDTGVIYPQIRKNPSSVYSLLLVAGYLKAERADPAFGGDYMCEVALPNREIAFVYHKVDSAKIDGYHSHV